MISIIDFGSQFTQLIARKIREIGVYSVIVPFSQISDESYIASLKKAKGVILSGSYHSVYSDSSPDLPSFILDLNIPLLGICYGQQLLCKIFGGEILPGEREFGKAVITPFNIDGNKDNTNSFNANSFNRKNSQHPLIDEFFSENNSQIVWMSHGDSISNLPNNFSVLASSEDHEYAIIADDQKKIYGTQFHPEVIHSNNGEILLRNFARNICDIKENWSEENIIQSIADRIAAELRADQDSHIHAEKRDYNEENNKEENGDNACKGHIVCALSGGVDSTVTATLLANIAKEKLHCIFVDHGMLRENEADEVRNMYENLHLNIKYIDASEKFLASLKGVTDPEAKRKIIGKLFIDTFTEEIKNIEREGRVSIEYLAQGTIYPDVIESLAVVGANKTTIKSHHNVGGLPDNLKLKLIEPLRYLFKDEVRKIGNTLGLPEIFLSRHPFPGPGLAIRMIGEVTKARCDILRKADAIFIEELRAYNIYDDVWQAYAALSGMKSVGVMGDARTYEEACILRAVTARDGMTADFAKLPHDFLGNVAQRIVNEVRGINRVFYDITSKPPASIELE